MKTFHERLKSWVKQPIFWIFLLGLLLRLGSVALNFHEMRWQNEPRMTIPAARLLEGKGISLADGIGQSAYRPPLYILWIAAMYAIFGTFSLIGPSIVQALASSANILLLFLLAKQLWKRDDIANASALLLAIHPYTVYHDTQLYHTFLTTGLILGGLLMLLRGIESGRTRPFFWSGLLFGLTILVISTVVPFLGLLLLAGLLLWKIPFMRRLVFIGTFVGGLLLVWGPWIIRNAIVFHHFIPLTTESGVTLWMGNNPEAAVRLPLRTHEESPVPQGTAFNYPARYEGCKPEGWCVGGISEYEENRELTAMGMAWIKTHPQEFVSLTIWRFGGIWSPVLTPSKHFGPSWWTNAIVNGGYAAWNLMLALLVILGVRQAWKEERRIYPMMALTLALTGTASYALFLYFTKYRIPFEATLLPLAGAGLVTVWNKLKPFLPTRSSYRAG